MSWNIFFQYVLPSALGLAAGLFSPWANWGIEKRRQKLQRRRELVTGWRLKLLPMIGQSGDMPAIWAGERQRAVMSSPYYASLQPHLSEAARKEIENPTARIFVQIDKSKRPATDWNHHFPLRIFVDEIARIEREWKLV